MATRKSSTTKKKTTTKKAEPSNVVYMDQWLAKHPEFVKDDYAAGLEQQSYTVYGLMKKLTPDEMAAFLSDSFFHGESKDELIEWLGMDCRP